MFFKKGKEVVSNQCDYNKIKLRIEENQLEIRYIDNTKLTPVVSGKMQPLKGWYISEYKAPKSSVSVDGMVFKNMSDLFLYLGCD
jgi:hypothetical protein